jgi:ferredoxin
VIVSGALWQRRAFCKYLCFLGGVSGNYSQTSVVSLRADQEVCKTCTSRAVCFNGSVYSDGTVKVAGCPLASFPRTLESNADCNLCGNCVKNCPNDAITLSVRKPTKELWFIRKPRIEVAFLAMAIMGIVLLQNLTMLSIWPTILDWFGSVLGTTNYAVTFTAAFAVAIALPVSALALTSLIATPASSETMWKNFARFGYALIPLDVAAHIAHNLFHLLSEGKAVIFTAMPLFGGDIPTDSRALASMAVIQVLQFTLLGLGIVGSLYAAFRMARRRYPIAGRRNKVLAPYWVLIIALGLLNVWMFTIPMVHRV